MLNVARICLILPLAFLVSRGVARGDSIRVGGPPNQATCVPFGCSANGTLQQVYAASLFPDVFALTGLDFFNTTLEPPRDELIDPARYDITFSTTSAIVNGLNSTDFAANLGADARLVFSGQRGGELPPGPDVPLAFNWIEPFQYNPRSGNLLVEIRKTGGVFEPGRPGVVFLDATNAGQRTSLIWNDLLSSPDLSMVAWRMPASVSLLA